MKNKMLGGLLTSQFLQEYWQKKPLLIRQALPKFAGLLTKEELVELACQEEAQSKLVQFYRNKWTLLNGPFIKNDFTKLLGKWALLVQDVNHFLPEAEALLKAFNFIPHARLDDLMVSFAPDGGGVGPHFDSYDVFLLQGSGKRLWQIGKPKNLNLLPNAPLRILQDFKPEQEWVLEPGDMLYLPPHYAHQGTAVGPCMTYSIGFRAPSHQELAREFLNYLQDNLQINGQYADPQLKVAKHPAAIPKQMIDQLATVLQQVEFKNSQIENFLGEYLSEPKTHVFFEPPHAPIAKAKFFMQAKQHGLCLDLKSQLLFTQQALFMNGEAYPFAALMKPWLQKLANEREITLDLKINKPTAELLYAWYLAGYLLIKPPLLVV